MAIVNNPISDNYAKRLDHFNDFPINIQEELEYLLAFEEANLVLSALAYCDEDRSPLGLIGMGWVHEHSERWHRLGGNSSKKEILDFHSEFMNDICKMVSPVYVNYLISVGGSSDVIGSTICYYAKELIQRLNSLEDHEVIIAYGYVESLARVKIQGLEVDIMPIVHRLDKLLNNNK